MSEEDEMLETRVVFSLGISTEALVLRLMVKVSSMGQALALPGACEVIRQKVVDLRYD
jgi:hypothetical protein